MTTSDKELWIFDDVEKQALEDDRLFRGLVLQRLKLLEQEAEETKRMRSEFERFEAKASVLVRMAAIVSGAVATLISAGAAVAGALLK